MTAPTATAAAPATASPAAAVWGALLVVYVVWGSTYLAIRVVVRDLPPLLGMSMRFVTAAFVLGAILAARRGVGALRVSPKQLGAAAIVGSLLLLGGNGAVAIAEQTVPSGLTALLIAATPLWIVVLRLLTRDRPRRVTLIGTLVGFAGVAVLARPGTVEEHVETWGIVLLVCASLSWATGSVIQSRLPLPGDPFVATTYEMLAGGLAMAVVGGARGETSRLHLAEVPLEAWLWMAYLVVFGSLLAFSAFVWLLGNAPISLVATYAYVNPVVAVGLGVLVLDESVTTAVVVGGLVVVAGVALVVMSERPRQRVDRTEPQPEPVA